MSRILRLFFFLPNATVILGGNLMALKDVVKVSRKTFFNPSQWFGYTQFKSNTQFMWDILKSIFYPPASTKKETFAEAQKRLKLTDAEINQTGQDYLLYALVFMLLGIFTLVFSFYLLFHHLAFLGFVLGLAVTGLFLSQAFKYHFLFFQIKHRKLGCTFDEWWKGSVNPDREPKA
jgi:intracellular multiplication protein IcmV